MLAPFALATVLVSAPQQPQTVPEATGHRETSRLADVERFVAALAALPHGARLQRETIGKSHEGRELLAVKASLPAADGAPAKGAKLRALVLGNIHAGEVEGKEAIQLLLRELANGEHETLLAACDLWFVPVHNADGNERIDARNRQEQNGPDAVGIRATAQGHDLNRDFVKAEAPETRALLALIGRVDPHLFLDLHTTNGSFHGYHLTFAQSLSPNVDPGIAAFSRALLDGAAADLRAAAPKYETFDYGNFETRDWDRSGAPESAKGVRGWWTYDHRPRYGVNWFGLRNRIAVLVEAYAYCDFATRIAVTRAFVLAVLRRAAARGTELLAACALADRRLEAPDAPVFFGFDTVFGDAETLPVLVAEVDRVPRESGRPRMQWRDGAAKAETMPVVRRFRARQHLALPFAWAFVEPPPPAVIELLALHGVRTETLRSPANVGAELFAVTAKRKPKRPAHGHQELRLDGRWATATPRELPAGTVLVPARQPLGRLAAALLEPESEDSLSTWNFLEALTGDVYPVARVQRAVPNRP